MRGAADGTQGVVITRSVLARGWRELWRAPWGETQEGQHAKGNHHSPFAPPSHLLATIRQRADALD